MDGREGSPYRGCFPFSFDGDTGVLLDDGTRLVYQQLRLWPPNTYKSAPFETYDEWTRDDVHAAVVAEVLAAMGYNAAGLPGP